MEGCYLVIDFKFSTRNSDVPLIFVQEVASCVEKGIYFRLSRVFYIMFEHNIIMKL